MKKIPLLALCASLTLNAIAAETAAPMNLNNSLPLQTGDKADMKNNPLLTESALPFHYPAFDKITNEDYAPAFEEGMRLESAEVARIAGNKANPTFANTIVALEKSGKLLARVSRIFYSLNGTNTNPAMETLVRELAPKLAAHSDEIHLNVALFERIKTLYVQRDKLKLDPESAYLLEHYYIDFVRDGAKLSDQDKTRLKAMNAELAKLGATFNQNVLKELNASSVLVDTREELDGLSDSEIAGAAKAAQEHGMDGKYLLALTNTTIQPLETTLTSRTTRERVYQASVARGSRGGEFDNQAVILSIAKLRAQRAQLLGYPNYAAYVLEKGTAKTPDAVNNLLARLAPAAVANARAEAADMQKIIDDQHGGFTLQPWDWSYYAEKVRQAKFSFDQNQLRPYFEINNVLQNGVFFAAHKLYGISFKERKDLPVYHPTVRVFEVSDANGKPLALFISDMYARDNKRGGAWMNMYQTKSGLLGGFPIVANHLNIPLPPEGQPTLLTPDQVRTAFHEFGHALHGMFSQVHYPSFAGTAVPRDFVEFPSQVNEMWAIWPEVLQNYAKHYQTGAAMPKELMDKLTSAKKFNQGFETTAYLGAAMLDQRWHQQSVDQMPDNVLDFEAAALHKDGVDYALVPPRYRSTYFSHIFGGGYAASYYAYIWSEVLDADTVQWFKENGGLERANGDRFRALLLSRGGSMDVMQAFRNFRGRDAQIEPLLERRGLNVNQAQGKQ